MVIDRSSRVVPNQAVASVDRSIDVGRPEKGGILCDDGMIKRGRRTGRNKNPTAIARRWSDITSDSTVAELGYPAFDKCTTTVRQGVIARNGRL